MRDQAWLENLLTVIWKEHFHDVKGKSAVKVMFGRRARTRLGSISQDKKTKTAVIRLTALFKEPDVPEMIIKATLVHELCHYAHGFHSGIEKRFKHPHAGGVIRAEFEERGLGDLYLAQKQWLKTNWPAVVKKNYPVTVRKRHTRRSMVRHLRFVRYR
jgi:hypothetical protein